MTTANNCITFTPNPIVQPYVPPNQLIYKKMSDVMKEIGFIGKDQKNQQQGFKFRGIDQFVNALYPALCKHGVFMVPRCVKEEHELKEVTRSSGKVGVDKHVYLQMSYTFFAEDGSSVVVGPIVAEGLDSGDKATNKALSAALKYALIQTFSIPTEDMCEGDLENPEIGTKSVATTDVKQPEVPPSTAPKSSFKKPPRPGTTVAAPVTSDEGSGM